MKSPFPGMDPYLEGYLWPDVHHKLASVVAELLGPHISPKYVARVDPLSGYACTRIAAEYRRLGDSYSGPPASLACAPDGSRS